jgi:TctA family transporter
MVGVLLGMIGTDVNSGMQRFTMDLPFLMDGIGLVSIALGCFGIAEITKNLDSGERAHAVQRQDQAHADLARVQAHHPQRLRGSVVGSFLGILPGGGPTIAQFAAYAHRQEGQQVQARDRHRLHRRRGRPGRGRRGRRAHQLHPADEPSASPRTP